MLGWVAGFFGIGQNPYLRAVVAAAPWALLVLDLTQGNYDRLAARLIGVAIVSVLGIANASVGAIALVALLFIRSSQP